MRKKKENVLYLIYNDLLKNQMTYAIELKKYYDDLDDFVISVVENIELPYFLEQTFNDIHTFKDYEITLFIGYLLSITQDIFDEKKTINNDLAIKIVNNFLNVEYKDFKKDRKRTNELAIDFGKGKELI